LQLILSLGEVKTKEASNRIAELSVKYIGFRWHNLALLSSGLGTTGEILNKSHGSAVQKLSADPDRQAVVRRFEPALKMNGDRVKGRALFEARCLMCHPLAGKGPNVGPDLAGMSARPKDALLVDILDPSRQMAPDFTAYSVLLKNNDEVSGLIMAENEDRITLRRPNAPDDVIARANIREVRAEGKSLMPDGLEEGLEPADIANLLAFLMRIEKVE
jgi:putative heme-binding domain-containing protein